MIYKWFNPNLKYADYGGKTEADQASMTWESFILGVPLPPLEQWKTPTLEQYLNGRKKLRLVADCVKSGSHHLINQKSVDALADIWEKHATLYPVILEDKPNEPYYMVVIKTVIDCIDREKSIGALSEFDEDKKSKNYFDCVYQWVFREGEIGDNALFVLPDNPIAVYATEEFKQRVIQAGLTGFGFIKSMFDEEKPFIS
ncbi:hypothetical protein B0681_04650 [Moraxella porci DSM 25326]|uniref:Immunity MXAN-0049 protein domain-containing protein n=1 Tax=Moraxella porci DSM 25326 TaxID=573983 RepID=A0A1T0CSK2_9GAMM|nr:DUF1629 domain-containing protein [Moraxella porci]OOS25316.1 hypothetical protein B0681_04650 [Moraxella porci DSM 25326]